jgi:hypothetical protein
MAFQASHRFARISPRKVRPLADMIRGKYADEALDLLQYQPQRGARLLEKVIRSALGNAQDPDQNRARAWRWIEADGRRSADRQRTDVQTHPSASPRDGVHDQAADGAHSYQTGNVGRELSYGAKSQSGGIPYGRDDGLEEPLVRLEAGFRRAAGRGPQDPRLHQESSAEIAVPQCGHRPDRHRTHAGRGQGGPARGSARLIIGKKGQEVELLQEDLQNLIGRRVNLKIEEIHRPELRAQLVAEDIAQQLGRGPVSAAR